MTRVLLINPGSGDSGEKGGDYFGIIQALGPTLAAKMHALWCTGKDYPRGDVYDYSANNRPLQHRGASALADVATISGLAYYRTGVFPQDVAALNTAGFVGMLTVVNAGYSDLATGEGRGFISNFVDTVTPNVLFGVSSTASHLYSATMRDGAGLVISATLAHDALNGTRYEMFYAGFSPGLATIARRTRRDDGTILRASQTANGSSAVVPTGARSLDIGRSETWLEPFDHAASAILNAPMSSAELDEAFNRFSEILDTVGVTL